MSSYKYRRHLLWMRTGLLWMSLAGGVLLLGFALLGHWSMGWILGGALIVEGVLLSWFLNRFVQVRVDLQDEDIVYQNVKGTLRIPYRSITELQFPSVRYVGGWIKIISESESIRLTVVVEGIGSLLRELKAGLQRHQSAAVYKEDRLFQFFKTAAHSDQSWARLYEIGWKLLGLFLLSMAVGWAAAKALDTSDEGPIVAWAILTSLGPICVIVTYLVTEILFARRLGESAEQSALTCSERNPEFESSVYRKALWWGGLSFLVAWVLLCLLIRWLS